MTSIFPCIVLLLLEVSGTMGNSVLPGYSYLPPDPANSLFPIGKPAVNPPGVDSSSFAQNVPIPSPSATAPPAAAPPVGTSCNKPCPFSYEPMCGSDGITYTNECTFSVASCKNPTLFLANAGSCAASRPSSDSPPIPPPPPPPQPSPTPSPVKPVVIPFPGDTPTFDTSPGSGVIPFPPSLESLGNAGDSGNFDSFSGPEGCNEACTKIYRPVCGTDGVTYNNMCLLDVTACQGAGSGVNLNVAFEGPCGSLLESVDIRGQDVPSPPFTSSLTSCDKECTKIFNPVCGSDDNTYNSPCLLEVASCEAVNAGGAPISLAYEGQCTVPEMALFISANSGNNPSGTTLLIQDDSSSLFSGELCSEECTKIFLPVCGTDGQTYNNECLLNIAACKGRSTGEILVKDFDGPCVAALPRGPTCDPACDKTFLPICGSDGETYNNMCLLNLSNCLNPTVQITFAGDGPCEIKASPAGLSSDPRPSLSTDHRPPEFIDLNAPTNVAQEREYVPPV